MMALLPGSAISSSLASRQQFRYNGGFFKTNIREDEFQCNPKVANANVAHPGSRTYIINLSYFMNQDPVCLHGIPSDNDSDEAMRLTVVFHHYLRTDLRTFDLDVLAYSRTPNKCAFPRQAYFMLMLRFSHPLSRQQPIQLC